MAAEKLPAPDRLALDFALAKAYDDLKDYQRSFKHLLAANAAKRATIPTMSKPHLRCSTASNGFFRPNL